MSFLVACGLRDSGPTPIPADEIFLAPTATGFVEVTHPAPESPAPTSTPAGPAPQATATDLPLAFSSDPSLPRSQISIEANIDYAQKRVEVAQSLTYVNRTPTALSELFLIVEPNRTQGAFQLKDLSWADGRPVEGFQLEGGWLRIPLPQPLPPWKSAALEIAYDLDVPPFPGTFGYSERQLNLSNWYPFPPLYRPEDGWLANPPGPPGVGEYLTYDIADYDILIQLIDPPPGLVLAASAEAKNEENYFIYQIEAARNFTLSASPDFETLVDETGFVKVISHVFPEHLQAGEAVLKTSAAALELYADLYGPLTHDSLTIVEAEFPDGMEFDGLYFLGQGYYETYFGGPLNFLTTLAAHETAHQWWYGQVASDQANEPWLDEALSTYSEALFYERYYPDQIEWWWEFRVGLYDPSGQVGSSIYDHPGFRPYVNAVYLRGAQFLQALRNTTGDEAFFTALQRYLTDNSYGDGTAARFFEAFDESQSTKVRLLIEEYFEEEAAELQ